MHFNISKVTDIAQINNHTISTKTILIGRIAMLQKLTLAFTVTSMVYLFMHVGKNENLRHIGEIKSF